MQALVIRGPHEADIEERPVPQAGEGEALVRVRVSGICGSDLHAFEGSQPFFRYPQVPGHEVVGEVVHCVPRGGGPLRLNGRTVEEGLRIGDRVVLDPSMPCGSCHPCAHGRYNCCENLRVIGVHAPGALAEYFAAPMECLHRVPAGMTDELAVLAEPLSIGVQANNRARTAAPDAVLIIGAGTIGLCVMLVARSRGARVAMTDPFAERREKALAMGADAVFHPQEEGLRDRLAQFSAASGPSVVVEAVGTPGTLVQALDLVVAGGRAVLLGLISDEVTFPGSLMVKKELDFLGSRLHGGTLPQALRLIAEGTADVAPLITHRAGLPQAEEMLRLMAGTGHVLKPIVTVAADG